MKDYNYRIAKYGIIISPLRRILQARTIYRLSYITILLLTFYSSDPAQQWHLANGSAGNPIAAIDIYRSGSNWMYAIGIYGMIKSIDYGNNWDSLNFIRTDIGALKVDPYNSNLLYASVFGSDIESNDIIMSTDGGLHWSLVFYGSLSPAPVVEIDPQDHNTVYVAEGPGFIHRTTDQGLSWNMITQPPFQGSECYSLSIANSNDSIIYAGYGNGIFKSTNKGNSWQTLNLGFQIHSGTFLAVNPKSPDIIYAAIFPTWNYLGGVYKSIDGGQSWQEVNNGLSNEAKQILSIMINPNNPDQLFIGLYSYGTPNKLCKQTTNGGNLWTDFSEGLPDTGRVNCIVINSANEKIYCG